MTQSLRKIFAQAGVVFLVASYAEGVVFPFLSGFPSEYGALAFSVPQLGIWLLLIASVLPGSEKDEWGSIWPLAGYDNAIDAIYTRGPWLVRFQESDEQEAQQRITSSMTMFGGRSEQA
jgi:hypothetical protein